MASWTKSLHKALPLMVLLLIGLIEPLSSKKLKVHMIVNSHMDLGWVNTVDEYFTGARTRYGENVNRLFNSVFEELGKDKTRTYSVAEIGYLEIWWNKQNQETKDKVLKFLKDGQLELINGGWVGNDEATAVYDDIIQNFISGQRWTKENMNHTSTSIGWQMDSFGTSVTQAYLLKEAGYDATFFSRVDNDERQRRKDTQSLEFNWMFPGVNGSIFTHLMARPYYIPILRRARWIAELFTGTGLSEQDYQELNRTLWDDRSYFKTDHILLLICGDFYMSNGASGVYGAMDNIVRYFQQHPNYDIELFYSNPQKFVTEVKKELAAGKITLDDKHGDFFPLNEEPGTVWSGFFTSKAAFKGFVRWHSRYLTAAKLLVSQKAMRQFENSNATLYAELNSALTELEQAVAVVQHHDAVSGTMKQRVRFDYEDILTHARRNLEDKLRKILVEGLKTDQPQEAVILPLNSTYDSLLEGITSPEVSQASLPADSDLLLAVMNPGNTRLFLITANASTILTNDDCVTIESSDGRIISPDVICRGTGSGACSIYFTDDIEAYAWMYYQVKVAKKSGDQGKCGQFLNSEVVSSGKQVNGSYWTLQIDNGNVFTFLKTEKGKEVQKQFKLSYSYYESATQAKGQHHASGAYIFMPSSVEKKPLSTQNQTVIWTGKHLALVQIQSPEFTTTLQLLLDQEQTGFAVMTQLAPVTNAPKGCEIVMEVTVPDLKTDGKFFTDTNGYFMLERPYTPASAHETPEEEVTKNFHPMTTRCSLEGNNGTEAFTVFADRAQGASIQKDNQIDIMIHRVAVMDDDEGVDETLNEKDRKTDVPLPITTWHYFLWSDVSSPKAEREETQYDAERPLRIWLFSVNPSFSVGRIAHKNHEASHFPKTLKVNLRTYKENDHSIRLQNLDPKKTIYVTFAANNTKSPSLVSYLSQNNKAGLANISETSWTTTHVLKDNFNLSKTLTLELAPLQMRTFDLSLRQLDDSNSLEDDTNPPPPPVDNSTVSNNTTNSSSTNTNTTKEQEEKAIEEAQEILNGYINTITGDSSSKSGTSFFTCYLILHACVAIGYFTMCLFRARRRNVPLKTFKREMIIVAIFGPIGFVVLWYMKRRASASEKQILIEDIVPGHTDGSMSVYV